MTIEAAPGRAVVILSREELARYGIDSAGMSLADGRTRVMLGDVLIMLRHMGIIGRPDNMPSSRPRVTVECAVGESGGCMLFFGIADAQGDRDTAPFPRVIRFSGADAVFRAAKAGAFGDKLVPVPDGTGYILELPDDIEWWREGLLREFSDEDGSE